MGSSPIPGTVRAQKGSTRSVDPFFCFGAIAKLCLSEGNKTKKTKPVGF